MDLVKELTSLREKLEEEFEDFPEGYCRKTSEIAEELGLERTLGIFIDNSGIAHNHWWNKKDGKIYDLTADQFSKEIPKIYILDEDSSEAKSRYREGVMLTEDYITEENYHLS